MPGIEFGPDYPRDLGATVAKFRRKAYATIYDLTREERVAYADAVEKAIRAKQRAEAAWKGRQPDRQFYPVGAALRAAHRARLLACPSAIRKARAPQEWIEMYAAAMGWTYVEAYKAKERQEAALCQKS